MRYILSILALLLSTSVYSQVATSAYGGSGGGEPSSLLTGLISYWSFEEPSGGTTYDRTDNNYDGTLTNTPTMGQTGIQGDCFDYDEPSDEWIDFGTSYWDPGTSDMTISVWFKTTGATVSGGLVGNAGTNPDWNIRHQGASYAKSNVNFGGGNQEISTNNTLSYDVWYHIIYQLDRDGNVSMYLDNVLQTETADISSSSAVNLANSNNYGVGNEHEGAADYFHNGLIDEVGTWSRLLTSAERAGLYNSGSGIAWPLNY